jgi:hypothetical protein
VKASGIGYLERHFDPLATVPELSAKEWELREIERITLALAKVVIAGEVHARLGEGATRSELAQDKRRARRIAHALGSSLYAWQRKTPKLPSDETIKIAGAQLTWDTFVPEHCATAQAELRMMASWAILNNERRWGRSIVTRIENEISWLEYAVRE